ncbi:MAG: replicative DNA helicase [Bdellovibrionales bacterium]|nr:replicative DNA helicase [Bdellovibrionales bacterium]
MEQRIPPQNIEAEQAVIGGLLIEPEKWDDVRELISPEDFYKPAHKKIFLALQALNKRNHPTDLVTVSNYLREHNELESIGGPSYLAEIMEQIPSTAHLTSHAQIIHDKSVLRKIVHVSQSFIEKAFNPDYDSLDNFLDGIEQQIFQVSQARGTQGLVDASELVRLSLQKIEELYAKKLKVTGVPTGFIELDELTAGFQPGEFIIIAARPSMGKTAFSLNFTLHAALKEKKKVAYFSVEMAKEQVMIRLLASTAKVRLGDLRIGQIDDLAWPRLINTAATISETNLFIDDTAGISPFEIRAKARRLKATHGIDMIIIDYLQLMSLKQKVENRQQEVSEISKLLKSIAKELQIPVVALAQLNRAVEGRSDRRPMLSDLRESGSIEQDADVIMMLYREDYYDRENPEIKGMAEVIVGKQRNGPTDTIKLRWLPEYGLFENNIPGPMAPLPEGPSNQNIRKIESGGFKNKKPLNFAPST